MEGSTRSRWTSIVSAVFMIAVIGFAAIMTVVFLPSQITLVTDYVGVEGTVIEAPQLDSCGESRCFYADVRYPDEAGNVWVKRMRVADETSSGDSVSVRLPKGDPQDASTDTSFAAWVGLAYMVFLGPVLLLGFGWEALTTVWRRLRRIGEAE